MDQEQGRYCRITSYYSNKKLLGAPGRSKDATRGSWKHDQIGPFGGSVLVFSCFMDEIRLRTLDLLAGTSWVEAVDRSADTKDGLQ